MEVHGSHVATLPVSPALKTTRRKLIVRDGLRFLSLTAFAVVLAGMTTLLFRSFESHRNDLAVMWAARGRDALQAGHAPDAVTALRTSLSYKPDDTANQLALAEALAASGHTAEAENYFLNLWQARPGDGPINLQLARLERSRGNAAAAVDYYRAAVFGTWAGDAPKRRRDTRLELARYLIERGQMQTAQVELLVSAGNNPDAESQLAIGELLETAHDSKDAFAAYRNVGDDSPQEPAAKAKAGELCYALGDYRCAGDLLERALQYKVWTEEQVSRMTVMEEHAERLQQLAISRDVPMAVRTVHLLDDARMAQMRLKECAKTQAEGALPPDVQALQGQWKKLDTAAKRAALRHDDDLQEQYASLMWQTESAVTATCGAPAGDDALLVFLHDHPMTHAGAQ